MFIDTHSHIDFFPEEERAGVIQRARDSGVDYLIAVGAGDDLSGNARALELAERYDFVFATIGVHPHDAKVFTETKGDGLRNMVQGKRIVAIGETGLDFYRMKSSKEDQIKAFVEQIHMAKELRLPLVIHMRDSFSEVINILVREGGRDTGGVFHCFSGDVEIAGHCLDLGFYLSFAGNVTFKKSGTLREALKTVPIERVLLETDSPYLTPEPMRGKRNEPSFLRFTAERIAETKGLSIEDVARITSYNARKLFRIGGPEKAGKVVYAIRNSLYLNITNKCTNACVFCPKLTDYMVKGHYLRLGPEPSLNEIISALPDLSSYKEIVFCGFGEATLRLDVLKEVARHLKEKNMRVRLDTDGLANLVHGRNVLPELRGLIDCVSVSLNAADAKTYAKICPSKYGESAYNTVKDFIRDAKACIPEIIATVVSMPGIDVEACRAIAEKELGVKFRVRDYNQVG